MQKFDELSSVKVNFALYEYLKNPFSEMCPYQKNLP